MGKQVDDLDAKLKAVDHWASRRRRSIELMRRNGLGGFTAKVRGAGGLMPFVKRQIRIPILQFLSKRWDSKYAVDTYGHIELTDIDVLGPNKDRAFPYVATSPSVYAFLSILFPPNWKDFTFVDVGCGKGRALMLAALQGFDSILGIEFAPLIYRAAEQNLTNFSGRKPAWWSIINADVTTVDLPLGRPLLLYCYSPFHVAVWERFLPALSRTIETNQKPMCLVLVGTRAAADLIKASGLFHERAHGLTPFFMDAYESYPYWVFDSI